MASEQTMHLPAFIYIEAGDEGGLQSELQVCRITSSTCRGVPADLLAGQLWASWSITLSGLITLRETRC